MSHHMSHRTTFQIWEDDEIVLDGINARQTVEEELAWRAVEEPDRKFRVVEVAGPSFLEAS